MKKLLLFSFLTVFAIGLMFIGCAKPAPAPAPAPAPKPAPITLKAVSAFPIQATSSHGNRIFRDRVNQRSNGALVIDYTGGPEVIGPFDLAAAVQSGAIDLAMIPAGYCEKVHPASTSLQLSRYTPMEERQNGGFDLTVDLYKEMNARFLGWLNSGNYYYVFSNVLIKDPRTDFKGLKFRTGPIGIPFLKALGAVSINMQQSEVYTALQQKVVDGAALVPDNFFDNSFYEVCKYWVDYGFWSPNTAGLVNLDRWNTIPKNLQDLMLDTAKEVEADEYATVIAASQQYFKRFTDAGMKSITFSPEDAKWYVDLAYQVRWEEAKKVMKPEDYARAIQQFSK